MRMAHLVGTRFAQVCAAAAVCVALYTAPALAQGFGVSISFGNWYGYHNYWAQRCYAQPRYGHWARDARYEGWCANNARFRYGRPDNDWRRAHPWDSGRREDRGR